jgi:hypothetical protein
LIVVARQRKNVGGNDLIKTWKTQQYERERKKREEEEHIHRMGQLMREQTARMEAEDQQQRLAQKEKWLQYRKKLDDQLSQTRNRTLNALSGTSVSTFCILCMYVDVSVRLYVSKSRSVAYGESMLLHKE